MAQAFIECPRCAAKSYHPDDIRQGYCGRCHWWTSDPVLGQVEPPGPRDATAAALAEILGRYQFNYSDEFALQDGIEQALTLAGFTVEREVRLNPRDRIDLLVGRVGIEVKVAGRTASVARQCTRYLKSDRIDELVLVSNRPRHALGVARMPGVTVVSVVRPW